VQRGVPYQRSQSLNPSLTPSANTVSASGHRPTNPRICPSAPLTPCSPLPPSKPPLSRLKTPPSKYLGQSTCLIFPHTASRSLFSVSHTDSSSVLSGARRSSPLMALLRRPCVLFAVRVLAWAWDVVMRPVRGAREECEEGRGSSRSSSVAVGASR